MPWFPRFNIVAVLLGLFMLAMPGTSSASTATPPVIGLFTDYGWGDPYVAQLKGVILTINPNARLLDINHSVTPFNVNEGAYLLDQSTGDFPAGTIFVAVVDPQVGTDRDPILVQTGKGKFYVGPDNGLFSQVIASQGFAKAWRLDKPQFFRQGDVSHTFHGRDIFGPVAAHLASGTDPEKLGTPIKTVTTLATKDASFSGALISAQVLHIDRYGNVILNLRKDSDIAPKLKEGNLIKISTGHDSLSAPLVKAYGDVDKNRPLLLYGGNGLLEISVNQGSAAKELKIEPGASVFLKP